MRTVEAGFFSFTEVPTDAERDYDEWHRFDHLPSQYAIDGIAHGERWTARCPAASAGPNGIDRPRHLTLYLLTEPLERTLAEFRQLAAELRAAGRFFERREALLFGAWRVAGRAAAGRVLVTPEVVPWRPATGIHVIVDDQDAPRRDLGELCRCDGVAGAWTFERDEALSHERWRQAPVRITVAWLDGPGDGDGDGDGGGDDGGAVVPSDGALFARSYERLAPFS